MNWSTEEQRAAAVAMLAAETVGSVAQKVGASESAVRAWARRAGVTTIDGRKMRRRVQARGPRRLMAMALWEAGERSIPEIARRVGVSRERIRQYNLGAPPERKPMTDIHSRLIPDPCPWCGFARTAERKHRGTCRSQDDSHEIPTEIVPGLWVGSMMSRADPRFVAVVSILTQGEMHYAARSARLDNPPGAWHVVDHEDRQPGLLLKAADAWTFIDKHHPRGPVLVHCAAGASRSPSVLAGYLVTSKRMTLRQAVKALLVRPQVMHVWEGYLEELDELVQAFATWRP